ncbi:MAG: GNAT family N-acetyltransferase [Oscillospiraceae bacterium]
MIKKAPTLADYYTRVANIPFYGGRLCEVLKCYFPYESLASFYLFGDDSAIQLLGSSATVCGEIKDSDELVSFCNFCGVTEIFCTDENFKPQNFTQKALYVMAFCGEENNCEQEKILLREISPSVLLKMWEGEKSTEELENAYADLCRRKNYTNAKCYGLYDGETLVSTAVCMGKNGAEEYLSFVFTKENYRHQNYGKGIVCAISALDPEVCTYLTCEENLISFYEKCGFQLQEKQYYLKKGI